MKPMIQLAAVATPDGKQLTLSQRDGDFYICVDRQSLMNSRLHESELELARLACAHIAAHRNPTVLIGGLGMGYTLRQTLDMLRPEATVVVAELIPEVVRWNRELMGGLTGHPLRDPRVVVEVRDVVDIIRNSPGKFDAIMLDIDNGPVAMTSDGNDRLYGRQGIQACRDALTARGCLAVWSAAVVTSFESRLQHEGLHSGSYYAAGYKGGKSRTRCIWVASRDRQSLPKHG